MRSAATLVAVVAVVDAAVAVTSTLVSTSSTQHVRSHTDVTHGVVDYTARDYTIAVLARLHLTTLKKQLR